MEKQLVIGKIVSHYRIQEKIGEGGMGVVYRAHDEFLDRNVAVKVLPPRLTADKSYRRRLRKEAQALSKINHPNIEVLLELNTLDNTECLVVEYIAGRNLSDIVSKGALSEKEVVRLGVQLASGLAAAHDQKIVHCDIKPGNLRIIDSGRLKILDFGIAKMLRPVVELASGDSTPDFSSSNHESFAGTLPYMSPEQLHSEPVDRRSDIYAAGAVLYEMATGMRPFREETTALLIDAILHQTVVSPRALNSKISPELERIILKCLEKDPENRYHTAHELEIDLRQLTVPKIQSTPWAGHRTGFTRRKTVLFIIAVLALVVMLLILNGGDWRKPFSEKSGPGRIESLAVLPLDNLSKDPSQDYFADGMTEELITNLGKIRDLRVISRTSAMIYKNARKSLPEIARALNVDAVVEGTVLRAGERVRITTKLIQAKPERNLWSESYEGDISDILALQSEVALAIVGQIEIKLDPQVEQNILNSRALSSSAYEAYLQGRYYWNQRNREAVLKGLDYFEQSVNLDPTYALAYSGIADSYVIIGANFWLPQNETMPKAKAAALKALETGETVAEAHASVAQIKELEWDWKGAEMEYRKAIVLNPSYATAHQWYSILLSITGRHEEAKKQAQIALELDPLSPIISLHNGQTLYFARQYKEARQALLKSLDLSPEFFLNHYFLGLVYLQEREFEAGIVQLKEADTLSHGDEAVQAALGWAYAQSGLTRNSEGILSELTEQPRKRYVSPCILALIYAGLKRNDAAFEFLEKAYKQQDIDLPWIKIEPMFDPLHSDPRFRALLQRMNL